MCNIPHCCLPQESGPCLSPSVAVRPLRPATGRCLGGPLPRQLADRTRAPPVPPRLSAARHAPSRVHAVLAAVSGCYPPVRGRLPTRYSPVRHSVRAPPSEKFGARTPFDLHVLGTPPAFILSQDQTLMFLFPVPYGIRFIGYLLFSFVRSLKRSEIFFFPVRALRRPGFRNLSGSVHCSAVKVPPAFRPVCTLLSASPLSISSETSLLCQGASCQCTLCCCLIGDSLFILSQLFAFVNNFFYFFVLIHFSMNACPSFQPRQLIYNITSAPACQLFFSIFFIFFHAVLPQK